MVCAKCQKLQKSTQLATPSVKRKNELYHTPQASSSNAVSRKTDGSSTLGNTRVTKSKLLSKNAKNPYAAYSSSCRTCKGRTEQNRVLCHGCAYRTNSCAVCGKAESKALKDGGALVEARKFSAK